MLRPSKTLTRVQMIRPKEPAFHVCRFPVPAPRQPSRFAVVPSPARQPWEVGALAATVLELPEGYVGERRPVLPVAMAPGLDPWWTEDIDLPLLLPAHVVSHRRFDREYGSVPFATPSSVGVGATPSEVARVGWTVLCRVPVDVVVETLAFASLSAEAWGLDPRHLEAIARLLNPPGAAGGRLLAEARAGHPALTERCLQWLTRELLVVSDDERVERASWRGDDGSDAAYLADAWFPCVRAGSMPTAREVHLAAWCVHDVFSGADALARVDRDADLGREAKVEQLLSALVSLGFGGGGAQSWWRVLRRWYGIWTVDDSHPVVCGSPRPPSQLRDDFLRSFGVSAEEWHLGGWIVCAQSWWATVVGESAHLFSEAVPWRMQVDADKAVTLSPEFRSRFSSSVAATISELVEEARVEAGPDYQGLGSLSQGVSKTLRNRPVLRASSGTLIPMSLRLTAERVSNLHRFALNIPGLGVQGRLSLMGPLFEAYASDWCHRLRNHQVAGAEALRTADGEKFADLVVGQGDDYVAIEVSIQTLAHSVADGDLAAIDRMVGRYLDEADQAEATLTKLHDVTGPLGWPSPRSGSILVVTDSPLVHSPQLLQRLATAGPARSPRFLCSIEDLEDLVRLGQQGWGIPSIVQRWQGSGELISLRSHLSRLEQMRGRTRLDLPEEHDWDEALDRLARPAA